MSRILLRKDTNALEFYDVIRARRTVRNFTDQPIDPDAIKRILAAGLKAPTNDHMRNWEFVVLTGQNIIEKAVKKIPKKVSEQRVNFILDSWRLTDECQRNVYIDAIPKQYQMLSESGCLIFPLFKQQKKSLLEPKNLSSLNAFASIWCCVENILLAAAAEGLGCAFRIPLGDEAEYVAEALALPDGYMFPCYLSIGHPDATEPPEQKSVNLESKLHWNGW